VWGGPCLEDRSVPEGRNRNLSRLSVSLTSVWILSKGTLTIHSSDTPIHNGSWPWISILICELRVGGEEACMVSLSANDDRQLGPIRLFGVSKALESFAHLWFLFYKNGVELPLRNTIAVDNDSAWKRLLVFLVELETFLHHDLQLGNHLQGGQPRSALNPRRRLTSFLVS